MEGVGVWYGDIGLESFVWMLGWGVLDGGILGRE